MTTKAGVGMSRHHNPSVAGREAAEQALQKAGVERPDETRRRSPPASIGWQHRSRINLGVPNRNSSSSLSVPPEGR
jgi:hypothetical protein